jgi:hypothetical protein
VLWSYAHETCIILLTSVSPISSKTGGNGALGNGTYMKKKKEEATNKCINKWNNKSMFLSLTHTFSHSLSVKTKTEQWGLCRLRMIGSLFQR